MAEEEQEQFALLPALARAREETAAATRRTRSKDRTPTPVEPAPALPVARVLVDVPLAHLDRPFDYLVPAAMHEQVVVGGRVKVRFAGQDVDGFVVDRVAESDHPGRLAPLRRAVSAEPVLSPEVARLTEAVATRYAGTRADVLRLAVPPRHATVEKRPSPPAPEAPAPTRGGAAWWSRYTGGATLVEGLAAGRAPRMVWTTLPGDDWASGLAHAAAATLASGRGALLCVPDRRDLDRLDAALREVLGEGRHVTLTADLGPSARYRSFLAVSRGAVRVVAGTRAAAFAPVHDLGLVATWDDGDDLFAEPRAPYPHTREVLLLRAHDVGCAALLGGHARSVEASSLLRTRWATELTAPRQVVRDAAPQVAVTGATDRELERDPAARVARVPRSAHATIRAALEVGPVLVQTPRSGYAATLVCDRCREPARCVACSGPLHQPRRHEAPRCRWCGREEPAWRCPHCGGTGLRAPVVGELRTAEELGRAFPRVPVKRSSGGRVLDAVDGAPAIVVATPGAEPVAEGGYAAVVLLDTWLALARPDLRSAEEAVRRWFNAAALARPGPEGGRVVAVGEPSHPGLQALVRWDPAGFAEREADERRSAHLPPASRLAVLSGGEEAVEEAVTALVLPPGAELLGPVPVPEREPGEEGPQVRVIVRVPRRHGNALGEALRTVQRTRSAKKLPVVRVQVDPYALG
ncbi:primosomal protein N' [Nocardioides caldifontis]|uniref:primosomal protein N' n=1 Tax=Nocardioides caldifontis TaxID=2588938 RepID=UPI0011DF40C5|nr:primosomal protein N' [Nocardioides caldifontis]